MDKAQGMSLKVIIIAVIALIVLVVLVLIFTGKAKMFTKGTGDTADAYGTDKCKIPGTDRVCLDKISCEQQGGSWDNRGDKGYTDCPYQGCCSKWEKKQCLEKL